MTFSTRSSATAMVAITALASLVALSFVATPVKFLAEGVPIEHLLAVGRVTFRASGALEGTLLVFLTLLARGRARIVAYVVAAALAFQWIILMPELDSRTLARMSGAVVPPSGLHGWWIALDALRVGLYGAIAWVAMRSACGKPAPNDLERYPSAAI